MTQASANELRAVRHGFEVRRVRDHPTIPGTRDLASSACRPYACGDRPAVVALPRSRRLWLSADNFVAVADVHPTSPAHSLALLVSFRQSGEEGGVF